MPGSDEAAGGSGGAQARGGQEALGGPAGSPGLRTTDLDLKIQTHRSPKGHGLHSARKAGACGWWEGRSE